KLLLIGSGVGGSDHPGDFSVARLTLAGQFDPAFAGTGGTQTDLGGTDLGFRGTIQSDGELVVAGWSYTDTYHLALARSVPNAPPVAAVASYAVPPGPPLVVSAAGVLANDPAPDPGDALHCPAASATGPTHGTLVLSDNGSFTYTPDDGYT